MLVCLPVSHADLHLAKELLAWMAELDPSQSRHHCLIVSSSQVPVEEVQELLARASNLFSKATAIKQRDVVEEGWPRSANALFRMAADWAAANAAGHWLWLEADCVALAPGWLDTLDLEYRRCGKAFCGAIYEHPVKHLNGVMLYPQNVNSANPYMTANTGRPWDLMRPDVTMKNGHNTPLIQRLLADPKTNTPMSFPDRRSLGVIRPGVLIFHGCKDKTLIARLRERLSIVTAPKKPHPVPKLLKKTKLAVVLPFCNKDAHVALSTLEWVLELNEGRRHDNTIVLSFDVSTLPESVERVIGAAKFAFKRVVLTSYDPPLPGQLPQTIAFKHAANFMSEKVKKSFLWMEPDLVPMRPEWLEVLQSEYLNCEKQFMGSVVAGKGHCNGTAVYPANAVEYICDALRMTWTAWDTAMKHEMMRYCHDASHLMQHVWGVVNGKFHPFGGQAPDFSNASLLDQIDERAVMLHRCKNNSLPAAIRKHGLPALKSSAAPVKTRSVNNVEIMVVSYHKDVQWLKYCLASIRKFATGFSGTTILIPTDDRPVFEWIGELYPEMLVLDYHPPADRRLWHVAHQLQKFKADEWCPNADFICHVDSDCIFTEPVTPDEYFVDGKPVLWIEEFSRTSGPWKAPTEKALGMPVVYDTMRHHPAVHYRQLYADTRAIVEGVHKIPFDQYVLSCPIEHHRITVHWNLSEFECLGNVALLPQWKDKYTFVDLGTVPRPREVLTQFWSNSPPEVVQKIPSTSQVLVPIDVIRKVMA